MANDVKNMRTGTTYATFAQAVSEALADDEIGICKGASANTENVTVSKNIILRGYNSNFSSEATTGDIPEFTGEDTHRNIYVDSGACLEVYAVNFKNGYGSGSDDWGGSIKVFNASLKVARCHFNDCRFTSLITGIAGGTSIGVIVLGPTDTQTVEIEDCVFEDSTGLVYSTGAVLVGAFDSGGRINFTLRRCTFNRCDVRYTVQNVYYGGGAGIYVAGNVKSVVEDVRGEDCCIRTEDMSSQSEPGHGAVLKFTNITAFGDELPVLIKNLLCTTPNVSITNAKGWGQLALFFVPRADIYNATIVRNYARTSAGGVVVYNNLNEGIALSTINFYDSIIDENICYKYAKDLHIETDHVGDYVAGEQAAIIVNCNNCNISNSSGPDDPEDIFFRSTWDVTYNRVNCIHALSDFVDSGDDPYKLEYDSPCVDTGVGGGLATDIIGEGRPSHDDPDMGCYEYQWVVLPTPTFDTEAGAVEIGTEVLPQCSEDGVTGRYTTDGSDPTGSSPEITEAYTVTEGVTLKVIVEKAGWDTSAVASATYTILQVATPTFSPAAGSYDDPQVVTISCATDGATILYSLDGSEPSLTYSAPVSVAVSATLKATATKANHTKSATGEAVYVIYPDLLPCTFSPVAGEVASGTLVTISNAETGTTIHIRIDGGAWAIYATPVIITVPVGIEAYPTKATWTDGPSASSAYTVIDDSGGIMPMQFTSRARHNRTRGR